MYSCSQLGFYNCHRIEGLPLTHKHLYFIRLEFTELHGRVFDLLSKVGNIQVYK
jgi:ATP adenylyltransferase/5',5'''-P-1,P-4-tetraphosphate phosphorylase II